MDESLKFVAFDPWCENCEYRDLKETLDPCNECLETGAREGTDKPVNYKEKS